MKNGLDLLIEAFIEECENAKKNNFNNADDTAVLEKVEKYQRGTITEPQPCLQGIGAYTLEQDLEA